MKFISAMKHPPLTATFSRLVSLSLFATGMHFRDMVSIPPCPRIIKAHRWFG
jgi:hypothetical protein